MATSKLYPTVTPKLLTSFMMPDNFRVFGVAPVSENKAWMKLLTWPVVVLMNAEGDVLQTGYAYKELKNLRDKSGLTSMVEFIQAGRLEGHLITADDCGNCFILCSERERASLRHVDKNGNVSTVLPYIQKSIFDMEEGLAFLVESSDKKMVLFGDVYKGISSVKWPRSWLVSLFMSPVVEIFYDENKDILSISVDKKSDLICVSTLHNKIIVFNRKGQTISEYVGAVSEDVIRQEVTFDHTGCILVFNKINSLVLRLSPDGHLIQTLFPKIKDTSNFCDSCKKLQAPPKCREFKDKILITALGMYEDFLWVCRLTGEVELYRLI